MDSDPMIDNEVGAHTRVTVLAYWKFKSISLQRRVHKLSVPVRAERRIAFTRAYRMQPLAQLPAVCAAPPLAQHARLDRIHAEGTGAAAGRVFNSSSATNALRLRPAETASTPMPM